MNIYSSSMASCLVDSGVLLAMIEEERLTRKKDKQDHGMARAWCADIASKLDLETTSPYHADSDGTPARDCGDGDKHHLYHAVSAFIQSGFEDASILVIDGCDENNEYAIGIFTADGTKFDTVRRYSAEYSLGRMFSLAAKHCGLSANSTYEGTCHAGKVMGLATYCNKDFRADTDGIITVMPKTGNLSNNVEPVSALQDTFLRKLGLPQTDTLTFDYAQVAGYTQHIFERSVFSLLQFMQQLPSRNLIITGGCGLNCTLNGKIARIGIWKNFYVPPLCTDAGLMLGRAHLEEGLEVGKTLVYNPRKYSLPINHEYIEVEAPLIADWLKNGDVVAWFEGGSEYGPRALGHRSLLAVPSFPWMAEYVNGLKGREHWRPFAPVILDTYFPKVFAVDEPNTLHRYMLSTESVHPWYQRKYPSIVAQDGTSRPQVLYDVPENATLYHFMENYNLPILLNTSMNGPGEPICETLDEACRFVAGTPIHLIFVQGGRFFYVDVTDTSL